MKLSIAEFISVLQEAEYLGDDIDPDQIAENLLHGDHRHITKDMRFRNLIEFGRVVHAEMHALSQAAMVGRPVAGSTLYCTTYPCHLCAKHIISAGIASVVYIEPYPKSMTELLYHREIVAEPADQPVSADDLQVEFRSFRGISPTLYQRVFSYRPRKDAYGAIAKWVPVDAMPVGAVANAVRPEFEALVANKIAPALDLIHKTAENAENVETSVEEGHSDHVANATKGADSARQ